MSFIFLSGSLAVLTEGPEAFQVCLLPFKAKPFLIFFDPDRQLPLGRQ